MGAGQEHRPVQRVGEGTQQTNLCSGKGGPELVRVNWAVGRLSCTSNASARAVSTDRGSRRVTMM